MKAIAFTIADKNNLKYAQMMISSFHKFHPDIEVKIYNEQDIGDKQNYYRATPMFARDLLKEYDTVIKLDADQIITGDLTYVLTQEYDMGGVINFSRSDVKQYGIITVADIPPDQYFNCGFVVLKSKKFVDHWWWLCTSYHFNNFPMREQDLLNIMLHYCPDYKTLCFDKYDPIFEYSAWHGLLSKGEWHRMILQNGKLILPKAEDKYPERDKEIKVMHFAGGQANAEKMNYRIFCSDDVTTHLDYLVGDTKKETDVKTTPENIA